MGLFKLIKFVFLFQFLITLESARAVPFSLPKSSQALQKFKFGVIDTTKGQMVFDLFPKKAPWHVANFKWRADNGYYDNATFSIFIENYIIQTKGKTGGIASKYYTLPAEFWGIKHEEGVLGVARMSDVVNPERKSDGRTLHILLGNAPQMDMNYTIFGKIRSGRRVLRELTKGDMILSAKVYGE